MAPEHVYSVISSEEHPFLKGIQSNNNVSRLKGDGQVGVRSGNPII